MKTTYSTFIAVLFCIITINSNAQKPNLVIIHTDEHNFRTLGCYRALMTEDQAFVWGKGVEVKTPHLDAIAREGAICTNYYASSPVCTPSRASFVSGLYPVETGSPVNNMPMYDSVITFAEILKQQGYATSYVGKWHLDGDAKPGFEPERKFGFEDNKYMFNRGHWKLLQGKRWGAWTCGSLQSKTENVKVNIKDADEESFTTDFLTNRTLEIIERDKKGPFCVMLSLPDPHTPNTVRKPYDTMFEDLHFTNPKTMDVPASQFPKWVEVTGKNSANSLEQTKMQGYFGMVKCIDDNVGRIMDYLKSEGLDKNTILVFTSDHGDLMGEHKRHNKGLPYETSAKIPFIIKYPMKIKAGKIIEKAFTTVDFAPTILGMMDAPQIKGSHGLNASDDFLGSSKKLTDDRIVYITNSGSSWVAAVNNRYKLVISRKDTPWLFDLQKDPDEIINFYTNPEYKLIGQELMAELNRQMKAFNEPALTKKVDFMY